MARFIEEDKIQWEEWAPSLQDRLKALYLKIKAMSIFLGHYTSAVRITIGDTQPANPIPYGEIWWDTRYEVFRVLTNEGWVMTRATWYDGSTNSLSGTVESQLSTNPRTNCHCYIVDWNNANYCHCKSTSSAVTSVNINTQSNMAFNYNISSTSTKATKYYKWKITTKKQSQEVDVVFCMLNASDIATPTENAIIPIEGALNTIDVGGVATKYVSYDVGYSPLFSPNYNDTYSFAQVTTGDTVYEIPFTFGQPKTLTTIYGTLAPFSSGPVEIILYASYNNGSTWTELKKITLTGNFSAAIICHGSCHCARW